MVCEEDVFDWYKQLSPSKRIEVMCGLLHMCFPLELRFLGSCLENLARRDFSFLRESELKANSPSDLSKIRELHPEVTRARLVTYVALLHSTNRECGSVLFDHILDCAHRTLPMNSEIAKELLLLMTMAAHSPAFTLEQKQKICDNLNRVKDSLHEYIKQECNETCVHGHIYQSPQCHTTHVETSDVQEPAYITSIKVKSYQKRSSDGHCEYHLQVTWSNDEVSKVNKTYQELYDFHTKLLKLFPDEAGAHRQERKIPYLQGVRKVTRGNPTADTEESKFHVEEYTKALSGMPEHVIKCDHVMTFFGRPSTPEPHSGEEAKCSSPAQPDENSPDQPVAANEGLLSTVNPAKCHSNQVQPIVMYNPYMMPPPAHRIDAVYPHPGYPIVAAASMVSTPTTNHRLPYDGLPFLFHLTDEDLEKLGMTRGARNRFQTEIDQIRNGIDDIGKTNGMIQFNRENSQQQCPYTPQLPSTWHTPPTSFQENSFGRPEFEMTDSDTEYSSPAPSPRPKVEEDHGNKLKGSHGDGPQKSSSLPLMPSQVDKQFVPVPLMPGPASDHIRQLHVSMLRPNAPSSPAPSNLNPRILVRSPLRASKPPFATSNDSCIAQKSPDPDAGSGQKGEDVASGSYALEPSVPASASTSVASVAHMGGLTSVTASSSKASGMIARPDSLNELDTVASNVPYINSAFSNPSPQLPIKHVPMPLPVQVIEASNESNLTKKQNANSQANSGGSQSGYSSDSGIYQAKSNIPRAPSIPLTQVCIPSYPGFPSGYVPYQNAAPMSFNQQYNQSQQTYPMPTPPPNQGHGHNDCLTCGCPMNPAMNHGTASMTFNYPTFNHMVPNHPAFIPTSNGLISPSIPNFNVMHIPGRSLPNGYNPELCPLHHGMNAANFQGPCSIPHHHQPKSQIIECYNCGKRGHRGSECKEQTMDSITRKGSYHLKFMESDIK